MKSRVPFAVLALLTTLPCAAVFADGSVSVLDNLAPHSPQLRWDQFSTDLSATPNNPPVTTQETTVTGPTWSWYIIGQTPSSPSFNITGSGNSGSATVNSPTPSKTVNLSGGTYSINVKAVATYTLTNNQTHQASSQNLVGTCQVTFFVRIPYNVINRTAKEHYPAAGNLGHQDIYHLVMMDNQPSPAAYGNGLPHETFSGIVDGSGNPIAASNFNEGGPDTWGIYNNVDANGYGTGLGQPTAIIDDIWSVPSPSNPNTSPNAVADDFSQPWYCIELTPPYNTPGANSYFAANTFKIEHTSPDDSGPLNKPQLGQFAQNVFATALAGGHGSTHTGHETYAQSYRSWPGQSPY